MDKLFSEYSKQEKGMLTEQEFKEICLYEIENNPDAPVELYKSYVNMIDIGAFKNPFSVNESPTSLFWKLPLAVVAMNTLIGNIVRTKYYNSALKILKFPTKIFQFRTKIFEYRTQNINISH